MPLMKKYAGVKRCQGSSHFFLSFALVNNNLKNHAGG